MKTTLQKMLELFSKEELDEMRRVARVVFGANKKKYSYTIMLLAEIRCRYRQKIMNRLEPPVDLGVKVVGKVEINSETKVATLRYSDGTLVIMGLREVSVKNCATEAVSITPLQMQHFSNNRTVTITDEAGREHDISGASVIWTT